MTELVKKARIIAYDAHAGQYGLDGDPAFFHPFAVAEMTESEDEKIVALLHNVVEETNLTFEDLKERGIPNYIINILVLLTRDKNESYEDYIKRIVNSRNDIAINVKKLDLLHNFHRNYNYKTGKYKYPTIAEKQNWALRYIRAHQQEHFD